MPAYDDRAWLIISSILTDREHFIRNFSRSAPKHIKQMQMQLASGLLMTISFENIENVYFNVRPTESPIDDDAHWTNVELRLSGKVVANARFNRHGIELFSYAPGNWERAFGIQPRPTDRALLPPALRSLENG